jgi:hypothetical protein
MLGAGLVSARQTPGDKICRRLRWSYDTPKYLPRRVGNCVVQVLALKVPCRFARGLETPCSFEEEHQWRIIRVGAKPLFIRIVKLFGHIASFHSIY